MTAPPRKGRGGSVSPVARRGPGGRSVGRVSEPPADPTSWTSVMPLARGERPLSPWSGAASRRLSTPALESREFPRVGGSSPPTDHRVDPASTPLLRGSCVGMAPPDGLGPPIPTQRSRLVPRGRVRLLPYPLAGRSGRGDPGGSLHVETTCRDVEIGDGAGGVRSIARADPIPGQAWLLYFAPDPAPGRPIRSRRNKNAKNARPPTSETRASGTATASPVGVSVSKTTAAAAASSAMV